MKLNEASLTAPVVAGEEIGLARGQAGPRHGAGLAVEAVVQDSVVVPGVRGPLLSLLVIRGTSPARGDSGRGKIVDVSLDLADGGLGLQPPHFLTLLIIPSSNITVGHYFVLGCCLYHIVVVCMNVVRCLLHNLVINLARLGVLNTVLQLGSGCGLSGTWK